MFLVLELYKINASGASHPSGKNISINAKHIESMITYNGKETRITMVSGEKHEVVISSEEIRRMIKEL